MAVAGSSQGAQAAGPGGVKKYLRASCGTSSVFAENNCWSLTSCGPLGGLIPTANDEVVFDACSLTTPKMTADKTIWSLDTTGWAGTFQILTFRLYATDHVTVGGGSFTMTTSTTTGVDTPILTLSSGGKIVCDGTPCGITIAKQMKFWASSGNVEIVGWAKFDTAPVDVQWRMNPTVAGATVNMVLGGVSGSFILSRDGIDVQSVTADSAGATFAVTGGWSTHDMRIYPFPASPPGSSTPPPVTAPAPAAPGPYYMLPFGLVFHDGHILGPGLIATMFLLLIGLILGIDRKALFVIAAIEIVIVFTVSLILGATIEYVTIIALFAITSLFVGQFMGIGFRNAVILSLSGAALMAMLMFFGVSITV